MYYFYSYLAESYVLLLLILKPFNHVHASDALYLPILYLFILYFQGLGLNIVYTMYVKTFP